MQVQCNSSQSASLNFKKLHETETMADSNDSKPIENWPLNGQFVHAYFLNLGL